MTIVSVMIGAAGIPPGRLFTALTGYGADASSLDRDRLILWSIRLPRIAATMIVGALLASAGAIMQGLFRNPLADPSLVGVSSGAGLAAAATIVIGDKFLAASIGQVPFEILPLTAFLGALIATGALYRLATHDLRTSIAIFLLGGHRDRGARQCRDRAAGVCRRRPAIARRDVLAAGLDGRGDLAEGCGDRSLSAHRRAAASPFIAAGSTCWCLAKPRPSMPASRCSD